MSNDCKYTVEACVGAWLHNKLLADEEVTVRDGALVERLHRELGTPGLEALTAELPDSLNRDVARAALSVAGSERRGTE